MDLSICALALGSGVILGIFYGRAVVQTARPNILAQLIRLTLFCAISWRILHYGIAPLILMMGALLITLWTYALLVIYGDSWKT